MAASRELAKGWNDANLGVVPKLFLLVGGLMLLVFNVAWLIPYMGIVALSYGVYSGSALAALLRSQDIAARRLRPKCKNDTPS